MRPLEGPRAARRDELAATVALANSAFYPEGQLDMGRCFPTLFREENLQNLRIMLDRGRPVALVGFTLSGVCLLGAAFRFACLGAVSTLAEYRGRGLASRLLRDALAQAGRQGAQVVLISGAHSLYRRQGFIDAGLYRRLRIDRAQRLPAQRCQLREYEAPELDALARLQHQEAVRFIRSAEDFRAFLETGRLFCKPSRTWLVNQGGSPLAYFCASEPSLEEGIRVLRVGEIGGARRALLAALPQIFLASRAERIEIDTLDSDAQMESLGRAFGIPAPLRGFPGTVKIVDGPGFFRSLRSYLEQRLTSQELARLRISCGSEVRFRFGRAEHRLPTKQELTALVFGSVERPAALPAEPPLRELLGRLFPLPLVDYGLNYI